MRWGAYRKRFGQIIVRHMWATGLLSKPQAFFRLAEVAADDVLEVLKVDLRVGVEGVDVVDRDQAAGHVPLVVADTLVLFLDVGLRLVVPSPNSRMYISGYL